MKKTKVRKALLETTTKWDAVEHLSTSDYMALYLEAAFEDGDISIICAVLGDIAKARGMAEIAEKTGLGRTSLYKALSPGGHPEFETILKVITALELKLQIVPAAKDIV